MTQKINTGMPQLDRDLSELLSFLDDAASDELAEACAKNDVTTQNQIVGALSPTVHGLVRMLGTPQSFNKLAVSLRSDDAELLKQARDRLEERGLLGKPCWAAARSQQRGNRPTFESLARSFSTVATQATWHQVPSGLSPRIRLMAISPTNDKSIDATLAWGDALKIINGLLGSIDDQLSFMENVGGQNDSLFATLSVDAERDGLEFKNVSDLAHQLAERLSRLGAANGGNAEDNGDGGDMD